jgi:hypothetical protein
MIRTIREEIDTRKVVIYEKKYRLNLSDGSVAHKWYKTFVVLTPTYFPEFDEYLAENSIEIDTPLMQLKHDIKYSKGILCQKNVNVVGSNIVSYIKIKSNEFNILNFALYEFTTKFLGITLNRRRKWISMT